MKIIDRILVKRSEIKKMKTDEVLPDPEKKKVFSGYQIFMIAILSFIQFTVILDFMVLSPLGAQLLRELHITTSRFGLVVSAYAFSAGISGLLTAGFADRFDRKKLLLFFYAGFVAGTFFCSQAANYHMLLLARIVTGTFGGVITSIAFAIITDIFALEVRGRVMGFVQMAFSSSQVLGIPVGLYLANHYGWHAPFGLIAVIAALVGISVRIYMKPIRDHLKHGYEKNVLSHIFQTVSKRNYLVAYATTTLIRTGGFMLMPFSSAFTVYNMGVTFDDLPVVYMVTGLTAMFMGPVIGKLSDSFGKYKMFVMGSFFTIIMINILVYRGITPLIFVIIINVLLFTGISSRMISAQALLTAVPAPKDRGSFMAINSSVQQLSGGIASSAAGLIVFQSPGGKIEHYGALGFVVSVAMFIAIFMMYFINKIVSGQKITLTKQVFYK